MNKIEDLADDYEVESTQKNNKGYDYRRRKIDYGKVAGLD